MTQSHWAKIRLFILEGSEKYMFSCLFQREKTPSFLVLDPSSKPLCLYDMLNHAGCLLS